MLEVCSIALYCIALARTRKQNAHLSDATVSLAPSKK